MSQYKIKKISDQNIVDICTNNASTSKIYEFLKLNDIDYTFSDSLPEFLTLDSDWVTPQSSYLLNNKITVVSGDDIPYFPDSAAKYSKNILEDFRVSKTDLNYNIELDYRNYGYATDNNTIYTFVKKDTDILYYGENTPTNAYGQLATITISGMTLPSGSTISVESQQVYDNNTSGNIYGSSNFTYSEGYKTDTTWNSLTVDNMFIQYYDGEVTLFRSNTYTGRTYKLYNQIFFSDFTPQSADLFQVTQFNYKVTTSGWTMYMINTSGQICSNIFTIPVGDFKTSGHEPLIYLKLNALANEDIGLKCVIKYTGSVVGAQMVIGYNATIVYGDMYRSVMMNMTQKKFYT
jgi:hypothetical protein